MQIDTLSITREQWGPKKGMLSGRVRFTDGSENAIELNLSPAMSDKFLEVVGEAITEAAKELQAKLVANLVCFQSTAQALSAPGDD